jgi:hypothetical protein
MYGGKGVLWAEGDDGPSGGLPRLLHQRRPGLGESIAWQLEADGYRVVFQGWDFIPGYDWGHGMQHATATAERLVAVLSAAWLQSVHGEAEWRAFYAKDPSGERGLLLPSYSDD